MLTMPLFWCVLVLGAIWCAVAPLRWREGGLSVLALGLIAWNDPMAAAGYLALAALTWRLCAVSQPRTHARWLIGSLAVGLAGIKLVIASSGTEVAAALGLSYVVFKLIHVALDAPLLKLGEAKSTGEGFGAFLHFIVSPAMLAAGPIERWDNFQKGRTDRFNGEWLSRALWRIGLGLFKKLVIADLVFPFLAVSLHLPETYQLTSKTGAADLWISAIYFYLRVYVEFSGYSDIAVGAGMLWCRRLMENFSWPILATTPSDFWRRWHISLSQWCSRHVYMPLIGLTRMTWLAMFSSFLVMGLWHHVGWNRIGWAAYQTIGVLVFVAWQRRLGRPLAGTWRTAGAWRIWSWFFTQTFVVMSYVFAMAGETATLTLSRKMMFRMLGLR